MSHAEAGPPSSSSPDLSCASPTLVSLLRSTPKVTTRPYYGFESTVESGAYADDYSYEDDDEDGEYDFELPEEADVEYEEDELFGLDGDMWPSVAENRLAAPYVDKEGRTHATEPDDHRTSCLGLPLALPYEVETLAEMDDRLELICCRLIELVKAREWGMGFRMWNSALNIWISMGYPMKRDIKIRLIFLFYEILFIPGLSASFVEDRANDLTSLLGDRALTVHDFRIPWRPLYDALYNELFPHPGKLSRHSVNLAPSYLNVAEAAQRFFHPAEVDDMLETILPKFLPSMDSILATQLFLVHFLPISHCQKWLPTIFGLWYGLNSGLWDDQASDLLGQLAIAHVDPTRSDPSLLKRIPRGATNTAEEEAQNPFHKRSLRAHLTRVLDVQGKIVEDDDGVTYWPDQSLMPPEPIVADPHWQGIRKDIGIFTEAEFEFVMSKALRSLNVPVGGSLASQNSMSVTAADARTSKKILDAKKPIDRTQSLAEAIVFSMAEDAPVAPLATTAPPSAAVTPAAVHKGDPFARLKAEDAKRPWPMSRSTSTDSLAAAGERHEASKKYLAGSKALDHLSRLITSCETFFHPSNSGSWSAFLTVFLSHLASNFVERWKQEQEPTCKTPVAWRLTPEIKRAFVLCLRPVALSAMFNKDIDSAQPAVVTLKRLSLLEPDLIMPAIMERAIPSLQGLEETQRTTSVTFALAALAAPLTSRHIWRMGGLYVASIFTALLPGIDLNDPTKTGLACMAICNMVDFVRLSDVSEAEGNDAAPGARATRKLLRPIPEDDPNDPVSNELEDLTPEEIDARIRMSTAEFRDWVPEFISRVLLLFSNLPEEGGRTGRAGGKQEMMTLKSVLHTTGSIFASLDDKLFDAAVDQIAEYAMTTTRANAVEAVGELVRNLATVNAAKTFARFFPLCKQRITSELQAGASSIRTTTTSIPRQSDATLHWWQAILHGLLVPGRIVLSEPAHRFAYVELLRTMIHSTYSERGWAWTGKIIEKSTSCLTSLYLEEMKPLNIADRESEDFKLNQHMYWGKLYRPVEAQPVWKRPTGSDVDMVFDVIALADEAVVALHNLVDNHAFGNPEWTNDFCRAINVVDNTLLGTYSFMLESEAIKTGGKLAESHLPAEFLALPAPYKCGLVLADPSDPRYVRVLEFRTRVGEILNKAATVMRTAGDSDSSVDTVKLLVTTMGTFLTSYGMRTKRFNDASTAFSSLQANKRLYESQRKHHRSVFLAAAQIHHSNRLTTIGYYRIRSEMDDRLIVNMLDFCLSPFMRIRRRAQAQLETIAKIYRGTWVLCYPALTDALKPGTDSDRMKGALYVLRYNIVGLARMSRDWRGLVDIVECLLKAHFEEKQSVQALIAKTNDELLAKIREPVTFRLDVRCEAADAAADALVQLLAYKPSGDVVGRAIAGEESRIAYQEEQYDILIDRVLAIADNSALNWRYLQSCARYIYSMTRRDKASDKRLMTFFLDKLRNPHPRIRDYGTAGVTRMLFQATLRSFCHGSPLKLFLQEPNDPFTSEIKLDNPDAEFTNRYLAGFRSEADETTPLYDRLESGWLAWGTKLETARFSDWDEEALVVEPDSRPAVELIDADISDDAWWRQLAEYWQQEETRTYPSANHIDLVLSLAQVFGRPILDRVKPIIAAYLAEMEATKVYDRHKTRAMWEFLSGLLRGSTEWPGKHRVAFWDWLTPLLPELFRNIRQDTTKSWDISVEYILHEQDPRRFKPLVDFMLTTALAADFHGGSAFDLGRRVQLVRSLLRCLQWRFTAWSDDFVQLYFSALDCPYADVRLLVGSVLNALDQLKWNTSYPNAAQLVADFIDDDGTSKDIMHIRQPAFASQLSETMTRLTELRKERPNGPKAAMSAHDTTAVTLMHWLGTELADVHAVATIPYVVPILREIFELREMNDNIELQSVTGRLLAWITSITPAVQLVEPLIGTLVDILQHSTSWRTKMHCMPVLSLCYFRSLSLISEPCKAKCLDIISGCLRDSNQEVREMASVTLGGFLRCSQRSMVVVLKDRFTRQLDNIKLPKRTKTRGQVSPEYQEKLVELHAAVLGAAAIVEAFPYTVPKFIPPLLADTLAPRVSEPMPISATIRSCIASFKRTHEKYQERMSEDQLSSMNYAQAGNSYYA
ncbi:Proteasome activator BLM10 [Cryptotrichosporon argae]